MPIDPCLRCLLRPCRLRVLHFRRLVYALLQPRFLLYHLHRPHHPRHRRPHCCPHRPQSRLGDLQILFISNSICRPSVIIAGSFERVLRRAAAFSRSARRLDPSQACLFALPFLMVAGHHLRAQPWTILDCAFLVEAWRLEVVQSLKSHVQRSHVIRLQRV